MAYIRGKTYAFSDGKLFHIQRDKASVAIPMADLRTIVDGYLERHPYHAKNLRIAALEAELATSRQEALALKTTADELRQEVARLKADAARLDALEEYLHSDKCGNGIAIIPTTMVSTGEKWITIIDLGDEDGSSLGDDIWHVGTLRELLAALPAPAATEPPEKAWAKATCDKCGCSLSCLDLFNGDVCPECVAATEKEGGNATQKT